jgi:hypothetical protein
MKMRSAVSLFLAPLAILAFIAASASPGFAQDTNTNTVKATQVLGLTGVKHNTTGMLTIENGSLTFTKGQVKAEVPATSITEVLQGADSQRTIGGTFGTITQFGPYGSGRFLSLFRTKIDTLSITYVDATGGVHGAVFTVPKGKGVPAKRALLAQGAKTSVPIDVGANTATTAAQKPTGTKP